MEARDASKGAVCFERLIEEKRDEIEKYAAKVEERPESPLPHKTVARCNFELMCALYSAGRPAEELREPYSMWVEHDMRSIEGGVRRDGEPQPVLHDAPTSRWARSSGSPGATGPTSRPCRP